MNRLIFGNFISLGLIRDLETLAMKNNCVLWIRNLITKSIEINDLCLTLNLNFRSIWHLRLN